MVRPSLLRSFAGGRDRAEPHVGGIHAAGGIALDFGQGFQAQFLGLVGAHDDHGGRAVVDAGGVAGGDGAAVLLEGRGQLGHLFQGGVHGPLIHGEGPGIAFLLGIRTGTISSATEPLLMAARAR